MAASPSMDVPGSGPGDEMMRSPGIAFEVEISDMAMSPPSSVPKRVRRRLLETSEARSKSPSSLEEIEAKLREADSRRQQFHEWLANKARPKVKSPPRSVQPEDLAERLQTKLVAAEQKRLELLSQEQTRLARLEELRAAARTEVQLRAEREREELESKVESRVQQAETNRLALLEAEKQRRALVHERVAQSVLLRTTQEGKDRERVEALRALICQKIAAADEKRENLLKAERTRAQAVVLQARKVAKAVRRKRELESRNKKELLEARLQRAKRLRAEFLGQRGGCQGACHNNGHKMKKHGDRLSRKLTKCWRQFRRSRRTTLMLAQDFAACHVSHQSVVSLPFEELAARITSPTTLRSVKALLARIESRFMLSSTSGSNVANINHLLKRLSPPSRKAGSRMGQRMSRGSNLTSTSGMDKETVKSQSTTGARKGAASQKSEEKEMERYPARVFLCAYMIIGHPEAVFSSRGEREVVLSEAASKLVPEFEKLINLILDGPPSTSVTGPSSPTSANEKKSSWDAEGSGLKRFSAQLADFDASWCSYLYEFVAWKVQDAHLLEEDLIRVACQLELSMRQKCNGSGMSHDSQAIQKQVLEDQQLLRERIRHLTGTEGVSRLETALTDARKQCLEAQEKGSPLPSPFASPQKSKASGLLPLVSSDQFTLEPKELFPREPVSISDERALDNERIVNEMLLEPNWNIVTAVHGANKSEGKLGEIQAQIKKTMEDAFWNGVLEGLGRDPPDYKRIVGLMEELKMELSGLVPDNWKQELNECLDVEIFTQVLESGSFDYDYFRKLLDYALGMVLKLGAPARDEDTKTSHDALMQELSQISSDLGEKSRNSFTRALVEGLRFVLQQVQVLKADISAARIQALTPILQGSAGVDYLQKAFSKRYILPSADSGGGSCSGKLPKTAQWLAEAEQILEQSKEDVEATRDTFWATLAENRTSNGLPPTSSMRTGSRSTICKQPSAEPVEVAARLEERRPLQWQSPETRVKLGILKMISGAQAVTEENVPETLSLNLHRLRRAQNEYQRLIILTTSLLLLRQNVAGKPVAGSSLDDILKIGKERLEVILEDPMVSMSKIGDLLAEVSLGNESAMANDGQLMTRG
ncbi:hypothetical protein GOP47_0003021 [Adiantum capillus-veneris]|uniref:R3H domain-containing protein n=1 Tax=Adiantum capillus-veneris TaxID=13818 RepID=A0A9D4VBN0_ADICA|nr:hypothetical protein GOP47_0003021 [Adiantum capillus-veneris]